VLAGRYNDLAGSEMDLSLRPFFDRPAWILDANRFATDARARVSDRSRPGPSIGSIDQMIDCTDVLANPDQRPCCGRTIERPASRTNDRRIRGERRTSRKRQWVDSPGS
jgi:hypothetical protein